MSKALDLAYTSKNTYKSLTCLQPYKTTYTVQRHVFSQVFVMTSQATLTNTVKYQQLFVVTYVRSICRNQMVGFLPRQLTSNH